FSFPAVTSTRRSGLRQGFGGEFASRGNWPGSPGPYRSTGGGASARGTRLASSLPVAVSHKVAPAGPVAVRGLSSRPHVRPLKGGRKPASALAGAASTFPVAVSTRATAAPFSTARYLPFWLKRASYGPARLGNCTGSPSDFPLVRSQSRNWESRVRRTLLSGLNR